MWIRRVGAEVLALAYAPDGRTVYTSEGGRVTAWDIAAREPTRLFHQNHLGVFHVNGLYPVGNRYLIFDAATRTGLWDIEGEEEVPVPKLGRWCRPVGPTSGAIRFVSSNGQLIRAHDLATGKTTTVLRKPSGIKKLSQFAFSPDEKYALMLGENRALALVTLATGKTVPATGHGYATYALQFVSNGSFVWVSGNQIELRNLKTPNKVIASHECYWPYYVFALHPSAPVYAALNAERQLTLFSLETGAVLRTFEFELGRRVRYVTFSPDGLTCAVGGSNKQFAIFDVDL
jgi:WD40 repeat protein